MFLNLDVHVKMDICVLFPQSHRSILYRSQVYSIQICEKETEWEWERHCLQSLLCCPDAACIISAGSSDGRGLDSSCQHQPPQTTFLTKLLLPKHLEKQRMNPQSVEQVIGSSHTLSDFVLHHNLSACKQSTTLTQSLGGNVSLEICSLSQFQKGSES